MLQNKDDKIHTNKSSHVKKMIKDLIPGDIVLQPIYRTDGLMLINKNKKVVISFNRDD